MSLHFHLVKETRPREHRVALTPADAARLLELRPRCSISVESGAGTEAGFEDAEYTAAGACVQPASAAVPARACVLCVKRAAPALEATLCARWRADATQAPTALVGALDALAADSAALRSAAADAGVALHALDQQPALLAAMAQLTGSLAWRDALARLDSSNNVNGDGDGSNNVNVDGRNTNVDDDNVDSVSCVLLGAGGVGCAALDAALASARVAEVHVLATRAANAAVAAENDARVVWHCVARQATEREQQRAVADVLQQAHAHDAARPTVVICAARRSRERAPVLITRAMLSVLRNVCVSDLALTEGGNVEGSEHDRTEQLEHGVVVTNTSGFPKERPREASIAWSKVTLDYVLETFASDEI